MKLLLRILLAFLLEQLARFLVSFLTNLKAARMDDPELLTVVSDVVRGIAADHPDWSGDQKRLWAVDAVKQYGVNVGKDLRTSLVAALVELAVQDVKRTE